MKVTTQEPKKPRAKKKAQVDENQQELITPGKTLLLASAKELLDKMNELHPALFPSSWKLIVGISHPRLAEPFWLRSPKGVIHPCIANEFPDPDDAKAKVIGYCFVVGPIFENGKWKWDDLEDIALDDGSHWYPFPPTI